jgi:hypothetical protein
MTKVTKAWSPEELEIMRTHYPRLGSVLTAELLPKRSHRAIQTKASEMLLSVDKDTVSEIASNRAKQQNNLLRGTPPPELPDEYIAAVDIFQVGYRVASVLGVVHEFAR